MLKTSSVNYTQNSNDNNAKTRYNRNIESECFVLADICACGCSKSDHPNKGNCINPGCNCGGFLP